MTKKSILSLAATLLLALGVSFGQTAIPGVSTRVANGSGLPPYAARNTIYVLDNGDGTQVIYVCGVNVCTSSGQWVASGGGGGGGGGANQALSNLSGTAVNAAITAGPGTGLTLGGFNGTFSNPGATGVTIVAGNAYSSSSLAGGGIVIQGGTAGSSGGNGGALSLLGGYTLAGVGGPVFITAQNGVGTNQGGGGIYLKTGAPTGTGNYGFLSVGLTGASAVGSFSPISGYQYGAYFNIGNGGTPGEVDFASAASVNGVVRMTGMNFAWSPDNTNDFDLATYRPRDAYFGRNLYVGGNITVIGNGTYSGAMTVAGAITGNSINTNGSGPWSVQGSYGTLSVSSSGKTRLGFGPNGPQFSFNGGALTYFATLDSAGVNVTQNANTATKLATAGTPCSGAFATGVDASGNALCNTAQTIQLPQYSAGCSTIAGLSGYGMICFDPTYGLETDINNGGWTQFVHPNLFNNGTDTLEMRDLSNPQTFNIYGGTDAGIANYNRLSITLDGTNNNFNIASQYLGTPPDCSAGACGIEFTIGSSPKWQFDSSSRLRPMGTTNTQDIGSSGALLRNVYIGTAVALGTGASFGSAGQCLQSGGSSAAADVWGSCGSGGSVTSVTFTGDGVVLSATPSSAVTSTGTLTATLANFSAYSFLANLSGSSAQPSQTSVPTCSWITVPTEGGSGNAFPSSVTNKAIVWGIFNPFPCITNHVAYVVGTADNTADTYALGLLTGTSSGTATIVASTASTAGTSFASSTGIKTISWNASNILVPAGRIYIALTSNCASACAALLGTSGTGVSYAANQQVSVGTGGNAFSGSITLPADSFSSGASIPSLVVY